MLQVTLTGAHGRGDYVYTDNAGGASRISPQVYEIYTTSIV